MAKNIPLSVSSSLAAKDLSSVSITASTFANNGATGSAAPVLISVESVGTIDAEAFAALLPDAGGQGTEAQARLILNGIATVLAEMVEANGAITVSTPFGTVETYIEGSVSDPTAAIDAEANQPYLGVIVPEVYRKKFADMDAFVPTSAVPVSVKRVVDKESGEKGKILGYGEFYLEGKGMNFGETGTSLVLKKLDGTQVTAVSVDSASKSSIQLTCHLPATASVDEGEYELVLTSKNDGQLWPVSIKVSVPENIAPATPTLTGFNSDGQSGDQVKVNAKKLIITGTNLANIERSDVSIDCVDDPVTIPATATFTATATEIVIDNGNEAFTFGGTGGDDLEVTVAKYGTTVTKKATLID